MLPWGAAEARHLGIYQPLLDRCADGVPWWVAPEGARDLVTTTASHLGCLNFYHPEMQQMLLDMAVASGAELLRPVEAVGVIAGDPPTILIPPLIHLSRLSSGAPGAVHRERGLGRCNGTCRHGL